MSRKVIKDTKYCQILNQVKVTDEDLMEGFELIYHFCCGVAKLIVAPYGARFAINYSGSCVDIRLFNKF